MGALYYSVGGGDERMRMGFSGLSVVLVARYGVR